MLSKFSCSPLSQLIQSTLLRFSPLSESCLQRMTCRSQAGIMSRGSVFKAQRNSAEPCLTSKECLIQRLRRARIPLPALSTSFPSFIFFLLPSLSPLHSSCLMTSAFHNASPPRNKPAVQAVKPSVHSHFLQWVPSAHRLITKPRQMLHAPHREVSWRGRLWHDLRCELFERSFVDSSPVQGYNSCDHDPNNISRVAVKVFKHASDDWEPSLLKRKSIFS